MHKQILIHEVRGCKAFLEHVISIFTEEDANYAPYPGTFTVAQQVAHAGQSIEWLLGGAKNPAGFDMDFEAHQKLILTVKSLAEAKAMFATSIEHAIEWLEQISDDELASPLPPGFVMGGEPKEKVAWGIVEHTAHHRGSLVVYARGVGKVAPMPYEAQVPWEG